MLQTFAQLANQVDDGEAACIAVAADRDCYVATDERGATRHLIRAWVGEGRQLDSARILLSLVREDVLDVSEADKILEGVSVEYDVDTLGQFLR